MGPDRRPLIVRIALGSYPRWWRHRYGNDAGSTIDDLLTEGRPPGRLAAGCVVGGVRERLGGPGGSSSPIAAADRLTLSVVGTHGAWMLALPFAFLVEVMLIEQTAFDGPLGAVRRPLAVPYGLRQISLVSGVLAVLFFGLSLLLSSRRARRTADRQTARLAALPLRSALVSTVALVVLVALPLAFNHFEWFTGNWDPRFLFGDDLPRPAFHPAGGAALGVTLIALTWMVLIAGPVIAVCAFSAAARRVEVSTSFASRQARLGSLAVCALTVNWVSLLAWDLVFGHETRSPYGSPVLSVRAFMEPDQFVLVLLGLMLLPLAAGLRSSARSWRARR